ncbi:MAG: oxidoreductase [Rhodobacteraceae bacterium]|nr:oxidoreductase [Paracoccaceae bacterium]
MHVAIVGAGQAGAALAAKLRADGFEGRITLYGAEPVPPYQRPPLSKAYLLGEIGTDRLLLRPESFYAERGIELRLGAPVTAIDPAARRLEHGGAWEAWDHLVLVTGATPRHLPAAVGGDLEGVHVVRTLADVDAMMPAFVPGARALVVGGGYIGLEAAAVARKRGLEVLVIEQAPRILGRVACAETADFFRALHRARGVELREGTALERLEGSGRIEAAVLGDGTRVPVDLAIVGIGVQPAVALAEGAGLTIENGIAVDAEGRTSSPGIWAAGDCASFPWKGRRIRLESVQNAIEQAEHVGRNILGAGVAYDPVPWFWSDQYDVKLQIAGLGGDHDHVVVRASGAGRSHWYFAAERFIAVDAMNDPRAYMIGKRLLEAGRSPAPGAVADPATDLKALLA